MYTMTCRNHQGARYVTKNPHQRALHFVKGDPGVGRWTECPCPFEDLLVTTDGGTPLSPPVPVREFTFRSY